MEANELSAPDRDFLRAIRERVIVFDGGMGATLEQFELTAEDYGGLEGKCHEALVLHRPDVIEGSYKVLRKMTTLDLAPNVAAFKAVQRIVARINPKIVQVDLDQVIDASFVRQLESSGFLAELRKKIK